MANRRGAAAVETALTLPVLLVLFGAIIEWGFLFTRQVDLIHAAREGARAGSVTELEDDPEGRALERVRAVLEDIEVDPDVVTMAAEVAGEPEHRWITVSLEAPYTELFVWLPMPTTISSKATMRLDDQKEEE